MVPPVLSTCVSLIILEVAICPYVCLLLRVPRFVDHLFTSFAHSSSSV